MFLPRAKQRIIFLYIPPSSFLSKHFVCTHGVHPHTAAYWNKQVIDICIGISWRCLSFYSRFTVKRDSFLGRMFESKSLINQLSFLYSQVILYRYRQGFPFITRCDLQRICDQTWKIQPIKSSVSH